MQIVIISYKIPNRSIKFVKIIRFKLDKINLNIILNIMVFSIYSYIFIKSIYNVFIKDVMINYLNIHVISKENF